MERFIADLVKSYESGKIDRRPPNEEFDFPPVLVESARQTAP